MSDKHQSKEDIINKVIQNYIKTNKEWPFGVDVEYCKANVTHEYLQYGQFVPASFVMTNENIFYKNFTDCLKIHDELRRREK